VATHGVFPGGSFERILASGLLDGLACTDTHPNSLELPKGRIIVESVAPLLADYLERNA